MVKPLRSIFLACLSLAMLAGATLAQAPQSKQVDVFGQKIHYLEAGTGPAVILLHGLGGDASNWMFTIPALASRYHVYAPDQIGFGQSDKPWINYRVGTLIEFLHEFCEKVGIEKASIVGNSLGGWTAAAFALAHPGKVERLVLVDAAGYSAARTNLPTLTREAMLQLNPGTLAGFKQLMGTIFFNKAMLTDQFIEQGWAAKLKRQDGYTVNSFIESILRGEDALDGRLGAIKAPTLIIWGREDSLTPLAWGEAFAKDIPGSKLLIIDRCGHVPQVECAAPFQAELIKFLAGSAAAAAK